MGRHGGVSLANSGDRASGKANEASVIDSNSTRCSVLCDSYKRHDLSPLVDPVPPSVGHPLQHPGPSSDHPPVHQEVNNGEKVSPFRVVSRFILVGSLHTLRLRLITYAGLQLARWR